MPKCYMMIGVPGSGKSTYIKNVLMLENNLISISTDEYIENIAQKNNSTYSNVYDSAIKDANNWFNQRLQELFKDSSDFIWDQTNINIKARKFKLNQLLRNNYEVHALAFEVEPHIIFKRLHNRAIATGKHIPDSIIKSMINSYQKPQIEEGFKSVTILNDLGQVISNEKKHTSLKI